MSHAHTRDANLLGALALALADRVQAAAAGASGSAGRGPSAAAALVALHGHSAGASIDVLRRIVGLTHSGAVRLVDKLAGEGLVERRPGADQRSVALWLTPSGGRAARRVLAQREAALEAALAGLSGGDRAALVRVAERMLPQLVDDPDADRRICRLCDTDACGRPRGRCPVQLARGTQEVNT
jgi:DNA-binding MarR family transcriptional regulator